MFNDFEVMGDIKSMQEDYGFAVGTEDRSLLAGIMLEACRDLSPSFVMDRTQRNDKINQRRRALEWLASPEEEDVTSFRSICFYLGLPAKKMRIAILARAALAKDKWWEEWWAGRGVVYLKKKPGCFNNVWGELNAKT